MNKLSKINLKAAQRNILQRSKTIWKFHLRLSSSQTTFLAIASLNSFGETNAQSTDLLTQHSRGRAKLTWSEKIILTWKYYAKRKKGIRHKPYENEIWMGEIFRKIAHYFCHWFRIRMFFLAIKSPLNPSKNIEMLFWVIKIEWETKFNHKTKKSNYF